MNDQAFTALDSLLGSGWGSSAAGYYVHRGAVHLAGAVTNASTVGTTLFTGLPSALRPATDVPVTLRCIVADFATPPLTVTNSVGATVHPDGSMTLDSLPEWINAAPGTGTGMDLTNINAADPVYSTASTADFTGPWPYKIVLGSVSWQLAALIDTATWLSLTPYLSDGWQNIDGEFAMHGARVHLRGHIQALNNGALSTGFSNPGILLPGGYTAALSGHDYDVAQGPSFRVIADISTGGVQFLDDTQVIPSPIGGGTPLKLPSEAGFTLPNPAPFPAYDDNDQGASGTGRATIGGLAVHPGSGGGVAPWLWGHGEPGGKRTQTQYQQQWVTTFSGAALQPDDADSGDTGIVTGDISDAFTGIYPPPDFYALKIVALGGFDTGRVNNLELYSTTVSSTIDGHAEFTLVDEQLVPVALEEGSLPGVANARVFGWVTRSGPVDPTLPYAVDRHNPFLNLLFAGTELPTVWTAKFEMWKPHLTAPGSGTYTAEVQLSLHPIPLYLTRHNWILTNDVLDLAGVGWYAPYTPPTPTPGVIPGSIAAMPRNIGTVPS